MQNPQNSTTCDTICFANHYFYIIACILKAKLIHIPSDKKDLYTIGTKIPRMPPGSKFTPPVMEKAAVTSPAEVVVSDCTILCSLPRVAGANTLLRTSLSLETQTAHLAIKAVSTASWQERETSFCPWAGSPWQSSDFKA